MFGISRRRSVDRGAEGQRGERVERVVPAGGQPALTRSGMVGESDSGESRRFGSHAEPGQAGLRQELGIVRVGDQRVGDPEFHSGRLAPESGRIVRPGRTSGTSGDRLSGATKPIGPGQPDGDAKGSSRKLGTASSGIQSAFDG